MILIDRNENIRAGKELLPHIKRIAVKAHIPYGEADLASADAAFEGKGPEGSIFIGVERKRLRDMLNCIDTNRFSDTQLSKMKTLYHVRCLVVEGVWKPDVQSGYLMECVEMLTWRPVRTPKLTIYAKLFRYLLGLQLAGVVIIQTRDIEHTAFNIVEIYQYFQKKWDDHTSLLDVHKMAIPTMNGRPSLVREWARDLDGVGVKHSEDAEKHFKIPIALAKADEQEWLRIPGIGWKTAKEIVKSIWGQK